MYKNSCLIKLFAKWFNDAKLNFTFTDNDIAVSTGHVTFIKDYSH